MKKQKHLYDPPVVETVTLQAEGFVCQSGDPMDSQIGFGWLNSTDNDLSITFESIL